MAYLLTASLLLLMLWPAYTLLLRYSDRYQINRLLLLAGIALVVAAPLVKIDSPLPPVGTLVYERVLSATPGQSGSAIGTSFPETGSAFPTVSTDLPARSEGTGSITAPPHPAAYLALGYRLGFLVCLLLLGIRMLSLLTLHLRSRPDRTGDFRVLAGSGRGDRAFTFGPRIYLSGELIRSADFDHILAHERVHARQLHTFDVLLGELLCCLLWFHPAAWWLRSRLRANLEYLVDRTVAAASTSRRDYQLALVRQSQGSNYLALALPFSEPTLKGRIERMTGLPRHWLVSALATVCLLFWGLTATLLITGREAKTTPTEGPYVTYFAQRLPDHIYSFDVYLRRIPTVDEYYQLRAILHHIPGAELDLYRNPHDRGFSMRMNATGKPFAEIHGLPEASHPDYTYRLGLATTGEVSLHPVAESADHAHQAPDGTSGTFRVFSKGYQHSVRDAKHNELLPAEELIVMVNDARISLQPSETVEALRGDALYYLLDDDGVAPVEWDQENMYPPAQLPSRDRMATLLGCADLRDECGLRITQKIEAEPDNRNWFESLELPANRPGPVARYNDRRVELDWLLDQDFGPGSLIQAGYLYDRGPVYVQVIDDGWGQVIREVRRGL